MVGVFKMKFLVKRKEKKGFTLIELLAVIVILAIIFSIIVAGFIYLFDDVDDTIDETTRNIIIEAANGYALEHKGNDVWKEGIISDVTGDKTMFCISLDSLIDKGYFKEDNSNYNEYRGKYAVKAVEGVNGVYTYQFVELAQVENDDICKYYKKNSSLIDSETNEEIDRLVKQTEIVDNKSEEDESAKLGDFKYEIVALKNNLYNVDLDLKLNLYDVMEASDVYINIVLDESSSMAGRKFNNAKDAALSFSQMLNTNENANFNISLIEFGLQPVLKRDFSKEPFVSSDFSSVANGSGTNAAGGLDLTTSLLLDRNLVNNKIYTLLLFDGVPYDYTSIKYTNADESIKEKKITPYDYYNSLSEDDKNYSIKGDIAIYYKNLLNAIDGCGDASCRNWYDIYENDIYNGKIQVRAHEINNVNWDRLICSSGYLKNLNSEVIVIGYGRDFYNNIKSKNIVSFNKDLCGDSKDGEQCYYYSSTGDEIVNLFNSLANNIIRYSSASGVKLKLSSVVDESTGNSLVNIIDQDNKVVNNIEKTIIFDDMELIDGNLSFNEDYKFKMSNYLYERMNCTDVVCTSQESLNLFNLELKLLYPDGTESDIVINQPLFNIGLRKENTLN